ncbi:MAG: hypothetical protein R3D86_07200 [Emcibacteraceae bacterium]
MFKLYSHIFLTTPFLFFLLSISSAVKAQNYEPWTGAVVGARIDFASDDTINAIRNLINEGDTSGAVREATKLVTSLAQSERAGEKSNYRYDAYNALCVSLTANKEYEKAMDACNEAIQQSPKRWQAYNSRGSLNYKTENFEQALADYKSAFSRASDIPRIKKILEHNIKIAEVRSTGK